MARMLIRSLSSCAATPTLTSPGNMETTVGFNLTDKAVTIADGTNPVSVVAVSDNQVPSCSIALAY